jgi:hypothetical protein
VTVVVLESHGYVVVLDVAVIVVCVTVEVMQSVGYVVANA